MGHPRSVGHALQQHLAVASFLASPLAPSAATQVLAILDGTALSWPGVSQAVDDLTFLIDMTAQTATKLENRAASAAVRGQAGPRRLCSSHALFSLAAEYGAGDEARSATYPCAPRARSPSWMRLKARR
jgi:hypothetical protein